MNGWGRGRLSLLVWSALAMLASSAHADPRRWNLHDARPFDGERGRRMDRLREERIEELRQHHPDAAARVDNGRVDALYDTEVPSGGHRMSAEERRQLRRDVRDAAREVYRSR